MLAYVLLVATASAAPTLSGPSTKQITIDFFEGTLQGFFDSDTFPHIEACASEATDAYEGIEKAIKEIEQLTPASVKAGIHDLGEAYDSLKSALVDCKAVSADIDRFVKAIEDGFKHPISFLFHLGKECLVNGREIYTEITTAIDDWKAESYKDSGVQIGKALAKILQPSFEAWKLAHGKTYATAEEEAAAREAFLLNADLVASLHMQRAENVYFHLNDFADLSPRQFNERNGLTHTSMMPKTTRMHRLSGRAAPDAVDWRTQGLVADVKNQGSCGSCWAFSTVVSIEGQHAKASGSLVPLSEQNLVDCVKGVKLPNDTDTCCMGCRGGLMNDAFQYMIDSQGGAIDTEASYSYTGRAGTCAFDAANSGATISAWTAIPEGDEAALLDAVATVGPISIAVDASMGWQLYSGGVKDPKLCSSKPEKMDHGVAIVGYGTEAGKDYWIIRNSWGARWGENGYMRIVRGKNACGLANAASYPTGVAQTVEA